jgi:hypothetical protein
MKIKFIVMALALAGAAPALAQNVTADPQKLAAAMQAAGYQAELGKDNVGDPMITSAAAGSKFVVLFYNCTNHVACSTIQFQTAWSVKTKPTLAAINDWNHSKRFAHAYTDQEGDPGIMMDVNLDKGGMSPGLFRDNLEVWASLLGDFKKTFGQ